MSDVSKQRATPLAHFRTTAQSGESALGKVGRWLFRSLPGRSRTMATGVPIADSLPAKPTDAGRMLRSFSGTAIAKVALMTACLGGLVLLLWFSFYLAAMRIYQVQEFWNVSVARLLATGHAGSGASLFQVLLSRLLPNAARSIDLLASGRLVMVVVFWTNWLLIAGATGERPLSFRWLLALIGVATIAPFWDHGFEVRPDNFLLTGILLAWGSVRFCPARASSYAVVGAVAGTLAFLDLSALIFALTLSLGILAFPQRGSETPRLKLALAWIAGALGMFLIARLFFGAVGVWIGHLTEPGAVPTLLDGGYHLGFGTALLQQLSQAPLLWALVASALIALVVDLCRCGKGALRWDGILPEALLFAMAAAALAINPAQLPSSLSNLAPFAFLLAFRHACTLWKSMADRKSVYPAIGTLLAFTHFVPFYFSSREGLNRSNARQETIVNLAEALTNPTKDRICDGGIGMVPTRIDLAAQTSPHALNTASGFKKSEVSRGFPISQTVAVIIPNFRTDELFNANQGYIRRHYVEFADDFWVLGNVLPPGGGTFEIIHAGRYRISTLDGSDLAGTYPEGWKGYLTPEVKGTLTGTLDGKPLPDHPVELTVGTHRIETGTNQQPAVVWVGPRVNRLHRLYGGDHHRLFYNWY